MKILLVTVCWNESPLVPFFLRHYEPICDKIIAFDNCSTDGTPELLKKSPKVEVRSFDTGKIFDNTKHLHHKNESWKDYRKDFDWVICIDFDEFLYHPNLLGKLEEFKAKGITAPSIIGFSMKSFEFPSDASTSILEQVPFGKFDKHFSKNIIFDPKAIEETNYGNGCHRWNPTGNVVYSDEPLYLLHFKKLGWKYEEKKAKGYVTKTLLHLDDQGEVHDGCGYGGLIKRLPIRYAHGNKLQRENHKVLKAIRRGEWDSKITNLVMTVCDYPEEKINPFVNSWLASMEGQKPLTDMVIFTPNWTWLERQFIQNRTAGRVWFVPFDRDPFEHLITQRWRVYRDYLQSTTNRYDKIMLTDCRDVLFQSGNIFDGLELDKVDIYGEDTADYPDPVSDRWQEGAYRMVCKPTAKDWKALSTGEYYCAGVVAGGREPLLDFCKRMTALLHGMGKAQDRKTFSYETGVFNWLVKCGGLPYLRLRDNHSGDVLSFARITPDGRPHHPFPFQHDAHTQVLNVQGEPFPILHFNGMAQIPKKYLRMVRR